jgi:peptidoglycan hydrolase CwlO-like protein
MMNSMKKISLAAVVTFIVTGCSSSKEPNMADMMRNHAGSMQSQVELQNQLAKDWETGTQMVTSAKKQTTDAQERIKEAEEELAEARSDVAEAKQRQQEGEKLIQESQLKFQQAFPQLPLQLGQQATET